MSQNEDTLSEVYAYAWDASSELLAKDVNKALTCNICSTSHQWFKMTEQNPEAAVEEALVLLKEVTEKVEGIKNNDSIPTRSNKKTGAKSKKEVREQVQIEATEKLKEISIRQGFVSGKWLIFAPSEKVDMIWSNLATSLASGPLSSTPAFSAKVATCPQNETPHYQHVMCLYMPDVYDKDSVTEVMKILLRDHGMNLSGVKSNLYTAIGIDSKHPSGIPSTVWKNTALMKDAEMKELKDAFFANISSSKTKQAEKSDENTDNKSSTVKKAKKLVLKKKVAEDDPFASDDDAEEPPKKDVKSKPTAAKRSKESDGEDEDERPKKKKN